MQRLVINAKAKGGEPAKEVQVLRSWVQSGGASVYLFHGTGIYGYVDGSPVKSEADLDIIDNPIQRAVAKRWWSGRGKEISEKFYAAKTDEERKRAGDFQDAALVPDTELDYVMYESRPAGSKNKPWGPAFSWVDRFPSRPDWWGQAQQIAFKDMEYRMAEDSNPDSVSGVFSDKPPAGVKAGEI